MRNSFETIYLLCTFSGVKNDELMEILVLKHTTQKHGPVRQVGNSLHVTGNAAEQHTLFQSRTIFSKTK